jgi:NitT/TauT family transport system permease protein
MTTAAVQRRPRRSFSLPAWWPSAVLVAVAIVVWQVGGEAGWWPSSVLPSPSRILEAGGTEISEGPFLDDAAATGLALALSVVIGIVLGGLAGYVFWRKETLGRIFEPYLVSFYTVPLVVFYPMLIVIIGLNQWPIVLLGSIMAAIPMALNTWVGLSGVKKVYLNLARSLCLTRRQMVRQVAVPAAAPMIIAGATLATIYALIGVVAMEFMVAQQGLGYRIRYRYESFDNDGMYFYIVSVLVLSLVLVWLLSFLPRLLGTRSRS